METVSVIALLAWSATLSEIFLNATVIVAKTAEKIEIVKIIPSNCPLISDMICLLSNWIIVANYYASLNADIDYSFLHY